MGVEHLPEIVEQLIAYGRGVDTPVALIREGTTRNQSVVTGTLRDIVEKTRHITPPAVLVVGEVVRLHEQLDWYAPQALSVKKLQEAFLSL
jgi:siroheme synthase